MNPTRTDCREHGKIILAHGEVTGHAHEVVTLSGLTPDMAVAQFFEEPDSTRVLLALEPVMLRHEEHAPIRLDPAKPAQVRQGDVLLHPIGAGAWKVIRQVEHTPEAWRVVAD